MAGQQQHQGLAAGRAGRGHLGRRLREGVRGRLRQGRGDGRVLNQAMLRLHRPMAKPPPALPKGLSVAVRSWTIVAATFRPSKKDVTEKRPRYFRLFVLLFCSTFGRHNGSIADRR